MLRHQREAWRKRARSFRDYRKGQLALLRDCEEGALALWRDDELDADKVDDFLHEMITACDKECGAGVTDRLLMRMGTTRDLDFDGPLQEFLVEVVDALQEVQGGNQ